MLNCLIIDDELLAIDIIAEYIQKVAYLKLAGSFTNPVEALTYLQKEKVDLIFLDIQMPQLTGLQFIKLLQNKTQVIIISAYNEYALDGYEHDITDYFLKPVSFERFYKGVQKAHAISQSQLVKNEVPEFVFVKTDSKMVKVNIADILFIEGLKNYISIYTNDKKRIVTLQNMKTFEDILPTNRFMRVHKSYIIHFNMIDAVERQRIFIGDKVIPIGETYAAPFFDVIEKGSKKSNG